MKKIIFVLPLPHSAIWEKVFFMQDIIKAGFKVEYWDITNICVKRLNGVEFSDIIERDYVRKFNSLTDIKEQLDRENIKDAIFIMCVAYQPRALALYRLLTKYKCTIFKFAFIANPLSRGSGRRMPNLSLKKIIAHLLYEIVFLYKKFRLVKDYDVVFAAGSVAENVHKRDSKVVPINHFDYDDYAEVKNHETRLVDSDYCVFLDDNIVSDTDYKILDIKTVEPEGYYKALKKFFDLVEKKYKIKVVIAAHPKSKHPDNLFGDRKIYKHKTNELVKDCAFALAHYSTSTSYAVLYQKPIIFFYTDEMRKLSYFDLINNLAGFLNCPVYNIDSLRDPDQIRICPVDLKKYDEYKYAHLTSKESESRRNKDIVLDYLKGDGPAS